MVQTERTGVLLIRVWAEEGHPGLRARITHRTDVTKPDETEVTFVTSVADINAAVTEWLREFLEGG